MNYILHIAQGGLLLDYLPPLPISPFVPSPLNGQTATLRYLTAEPVHADGLAVTEAQATKFRGQDLHSHVAGG